MKIYENSSKIEWKSKENENVMEMSWKWNAEEWDITEILVKIWIFGFKVCCGSQFETEILGGNVMISVLTAKDFSMFETGMHFRCYDYARDGSLSND